MTGESRPQADLTDHSQSIVWTNESKDICHKVVSVLKSRVCDLNARVTLLPQQDADRASHSNEESSYSHRHRTSDTVFRSLDS
jgi:hypothetical protein